MMTTPKRGAGKTHGYSLFELLVVIAIFGVATSIGTTSFFQLTSAWNHAKAMADLDSAAYEIFSAIQKDVADVMSPAWSGVRLRGVRGETQAPRFFQRVLEDDRIILPIRYVDLDGRSRMHKVMYHVERQSNGGVFLTRTMGDIDADTPNGPGIRVTDRASVLRLRIEYAARNSTQWVGTWDGPALPGALRVSLTLAQADMPERQISRKAVIPIYVK